MKSNNILINIIFFLFIFASILYFNIGIWPDYRVNSYDQLTQLNSFLIYFNFESYSHLIETSAEVKFSILDEALKIIGSQKLFDFYIVIFLLTLIIHIFLITSVILILNHFIKNIYYSTILSLLLFLNIDWNWSLFFLQRTIAHPFGVFSLYLLIKHRFYFSFIFLILTFAINPVVALPYIITFIIALFYNIYNSTNFKNFSVIFFSTNLFFLILIIFYIFYFEISLIISDYDLHNINLRLNKIIDNVNPILLFQYIINIFFISLLIYKKNKKFFDIILISIIFLALIILINPYLFYLTKIQLLILINSARIFYFIIFIFNLLIIIYLYSKLSNSNNNNLIIYLVVFLYFANQISFNFDKKIMNYTFSQSTKIFDLFNINLLLISILLFLDYLILKFNIRKKHLFIAIDISIFILIFSFFSHNLILQINYDYISKNIMNYLHVLIFLFLPFTLLIKNYFNIFNKKLILLIPLIHIIWLNCFNTFEFSINPIKYVKIDLSNYEIKFANNENIYIKNWAELNTKKTDIFYYLDFNSPKDSQEASFSAILNRKMYFNFVKGSFYSLDSLDLWAKKYETLKLIVSQKQFHKLKNFDIKYLIVSNEFLTPNINYFSEYNISFKNEYITIYQIN